jgi:Tfp pilus assembly PilM family ATPase
MIFRAGDMSESVFHVQAENTRMQVSDSAQPVYRCTVPIDGSDMDKETQLANKLLPKSSGI